MQNRFVETNVATQFGRFNFRVYKNLLNRESIVLYTETLDPSVPVLVRIHSECITGETFKSLQCDCGEQLDKALKLINKSKNGILIYLRQEGRGIGLFEKIKSYQLQQKGHDTFEANLILGHLPDLRTYEMVKPILDDLGVSRIRLLTNNPSKISAIAKSGIEVVERVPLIISANVHNKNYLLSKKIKFKHLFSNQTSHHFYQFPVTSTRQVEEISAFLKDRKMDPLLRIYVGVAADSSSLLDEKEITRIKSIFNICYSKEFTPVLQFSFRDSVNSLKEIKIIQKNMPFVKHLQLNDLLSTQCDTIKLACRLFHAYIPLCEQNCDLLRDIEFRKLIKKYHTFIILGNKKEGEFYDSKEAFIRKIDILLNYGLNDIVLCGGFGPNELNTYFELRRYYKINFSIDAQTKLETEGVIDIEKVKLYLFQLIRFDDPKQFRIEQTRRFLHQHERSVWEKINIEGKEFLLHPNLFHPGYFPSSSWFAALLQEQLKGKKNFCEVGCDSGAISCLVAMANPSLRIVATDINPSASENTKANAEKFHVEDRIEITTGDVLDGVVGDILFDTIFWILPCGFLDPGTTISLEEAKVFDPGYRAIRKFFKTAHKFLKPDGKLVFGFSPDLGNKDLLDELAKEYDLKIDKIDETEIKEIKFELLVGTYVE